MPIGRYWAGNIVGAIVGIIVGVVLFFFGEDVFSALLAAYIVWTFLAELIWGKIIGWTPFLVIFNVGWLALLFALRLIASGNVIGLVFGLMIISPCFSFFCGCLVVAITVLLALPAFTYPVMFFVNMRDTY